MGRAAHPEDREGLGGPPGGPGGSGGPPEGPGEVGSPLVGLGGVGRTTQRSGKPIQRFVRGRVVHPDVTEESVDPPCGPGVVGRPSRRVGSCRESLPVVRECSVSVFGWPLEILRVTRRSRRGWEAHPKVLDGSRGPSGRPGEVGSPPVGLGGVGRPTLSFLRGREAHPEVQEGLVVPPEVWEGLVVSPRGPGGVGDHPGGPEGVGNLNRRSKRVERPTQTSGRSRETHPEVWEVSEGPQGSPGWVERPTQRSGRVREAHPVVR